jgi:hypothetical protein
MLEIDAISNYICSHLTTLLRSDGYKDALMRKADGHHERRGLRAVFPPTLVMHKAGE